MVTLLASGGCSCCLPLHSYEACGGSVGQETGVEGPWSDGRTWSDEKAATPPIWVLEGGGSDASRHGGANCCCGPQQSN